VPTASVPSARKGSGGRTRRASAFLARHKRAIVIGVLVATIVGFVYFVLPEISGLKGTLHRLKDAGPGWIGLAVIVEVLSLAGYVLLFRTVFSCHGTRIGWRESTQITLAGTVASKLFAAGGAGGVALTVWALNAAGLRPRTIARRMIAFELLLYAVFAGALLFVGVGLRVGIFAGPAPWALTVVPAAFAGVAIAVTLSLRAFPASLERRIFTWRDSTHRLARFVSRLAAAPEAVRDATSIVLELIRSRELGILGSLAYWGFDIAALWASLHAFGNPPPAAAIVMAYFIGQLANVIPLPGGVGGVEGGMIGALIAFGTPGSLAILGVLAYRLISFWLPTLPGAIAYLRLRGTVARWRQMEPDAVRS
jgi:putative heme transporter